MECTDIRNGIHHPAWPAQAPRDPRLPLGLEAPAMTPSGGMFLFLSPRCFCCVYRPELWFWNSVVLMLTLALAASQVFATALDTYFQLTIMLMILMIGVTAFAHFRPFLDDLLQRMQVRSIQSSEVVVGLRSIGSSCIGHDNCAALPPETADSSNDTGKLLTLCHVERCSRDSSLPFQRQFAAVACGMTLVRLPVISLVVKHKACNAGTGDLHCASNSHRLPLFPRPHQHCQR